MSVCCGSSAVARDLHLHQLAGLALMAEIFFIASSLRLPMVMALANRSLSGPLSSGRPHRHQMVRDGGWIHVFTENGQEAYDQRVLVFRVGEDPAVRLPWPSTWTASS